MGKFHTPRHAREILSAIGPGWAFVGVSGRTHLRFRHAATGAVLCVGSTPSDVRTLLNNARDARRAIRVAQERKRA